MINKAVSFTCSLGKIKTGSYPAPPIELKAIVNAVEYVRADGDIDTGYEIVGLMASEGDKTIDLSGFWDGGILGDTSDEVYSAVTESYELAFDSKQRFAPKFKHFEVKLVHEFVTTSKIEIDLDFSGTKNVLVAEFVTSVYDYNWKEKSCFTYSHLSNLTIDGVDLVDVSWIDDVRKEDLVQWLGTEGNAWSGRIPDHHRFIEVYSQEPFVPLAKLSKAA